MKAEYLIILWTLATVLLIMYCPEGLSKQQLELLGLAWCTAILANLGMVLLRYLDGPRR